MVNASEPGVVAPQFTAPYSGFALSSLETTLKIFEKPEKSPRVSSPGNFFRLIFSMVTVDANMVDPDLPTSFSGNPWLRSRGLDEVSGLPVSLPCTSSHTKTELWYKHQNKVLMVDPATMMSFSIPQKPPSALKSFSIPRSLEKKLPPGWPGMNPERLTSPNIWVFPKILVPQNGWWK